VRKQGRLEAKRHSWEALIAELLALEQGLAGKRSLVDGNADSLGKTAVGRDDVHDLECGHIARDGLEGLNLTPLSHYACTWPLRQETLRGP
jgi:hypothetical protein